MVNVDISNIWCSVTLPMLLESEQQIAAAHGGKAEFHGGTPYRCELVSAGQGIREAFLLIARQGCPC